MRPGAFRGQYQGHALPGIVVNGHAIEALETLVVTDRAIALYGTVLAIGQWLVGIAVRHSYRQLGYAVDGAIQAAVEDGRLAAIFESYGLTWQAPSW